MLLLSHSPGHDVLAPPRGHPQSSPATTSRTLLKVWKQPLGAYRLISYILERPSLPALTRTRTLRQDPQVRRSIRLASLGRYKDAVAALSQAPPANLSATSCAQLESLQPHADSIPALPPQASSSPTRVSSAHILRDISSFPCGSAGGRDGMRPQLLQDILRHTAAPLRDRTLAALADLVTVMIRGDLPPDLSPLLASASLVGIPKPAWGIRPIAVGLTLRRLAGKVALQVVSDDISAHLQPRQLGSACLGGLKQ